MKLFIGLGNPGSKYQNTRHNLGAIIISKFVETHCNTSLHENKHLRSTIYKTKSYLLAIPSDFMNNSGISVQKIVNFYKIDPANLYIIHDDLDLRVGEYRLQFNRGAAGHHGVESIIQYLNTQAFNRVRIGISKPISPIPVEDFVLQPFTPEEKVLINETIDKIVAEIEKILGP